MSETNFHAHQPNGLNAVAERGLMNLSGRRPSGARARRTGGFYRGVGKRTLDILFVLLSAPIALLLIGISAALLWVEGGAPFYRQDRLGRDGRVFRILKLRTMVRDADASLADHLANDPALRVEWETTQKLKNDPRITRVGSILRKSSLDELPQLWNVLLGEMSVVGPRPMMVDQLPLYGDAEHYFALRPGITGLWQVSKRNEGLFSLRVALDAEYDRSLSLAQDLKVLFLTVGAVLKRTGY
ncbi:sugar transferase [Roseovarius spongiae]|uniref:Sugar transferase n=1 Tax=Roseovarius spongiae TaxID=2320272 RepID=A0A3A8B5T9_9RHOB|nr:sugar transferase [Roseovarius spongiae]RKF15366.1 sugar transferase [Roseovarius spongiae]